MSALYTYAMIVPEGMSVAPQARDSLDEALILANGLAADQSASLAALARAAFDQAFVGVIVAAIVLLLLVAAAIAFKSGAYADTNSAAAPGTEAAAGRPTGPAPSADKAPPAPPSATSRPG